MRRVLPLLLVAACTLPAAPARAQTPQFTFERVAVPMRDGVLLSALVWRPVTEAPVPVILTLTPYHVLNKALDRNEEDLPAPWGSRFVPLGYAYVQADVRGTYNSGGCWNYGGIKERQDGYDLVEWLGTREWSNGKVAMIGASYDGTTANAAAVEQPPHLATIVPISAISRWWGYAYQQGVRSTYSGESADIDPPSDTPTDFMFAYGFLPPPDPHPDTATQLAMRWNLCERVEQTQHGYDTQPDYDEFWIERDYLRLAARVNVPVLVGHGLLDFNVKTWEGTAWFQALTTEKMLVIGQWPHQLPAYGSWNTVLRKWFERWLYDIPNGIELEPAVRVQPNTGVFRSQEDWGAATTTVPLAGPSVSFFDDGVLTESEMTRGLGFGRAVRIPVPGSSGVHVEGRPVLRLAASSDKTSTHFVAVLCDVGADGACNIVSRAFLNARYAFGLAEGADLEPGRKYAFPLEFIDKDWVVAPNRHLEVIVASSSATWVAPDEQRATNTVYPAESVLELPLR